MARVKVQVPIDQPEQVLAAPPEPATPQSQAPRISPSLKRNFKLVAVVGLAVILVFVLLNDRNQLKKQLKEQATTKTAVPSNDAQKYQEEISKIVEVPIGQTPSLISVKDAKSLAAENQFFKNAQDGDVVLLYVSQDKSVRAILFRPSTHKVVEATSNATIGAASNALRQ